MPSPLSRRRFLATSAAASAALTANTTLLVRLAYAAPAKEDWITLFDGKTLKGWHKNLGEARPRHRRHLAGGRRRDCRRAGSARQR